VTTADIPISAGAAVQEGINKMLLQKYGIRHATLQLECQGCDPGALYCDIAERTQVPVKKDGPD
jgi:cobalt-zinc-cadmium efflux system protein